MLVTCSGLCSNVPAEGSRTENYPWGWRAGFATSRLAGLSLASLFSVPRAPLPKEDVIVAATRVGPLSWAWHSATPPQWCRVVRWFLLHEG